MSNQAYSATKNPYWLSTSGVDVIHLNENQTPPLAYIDKHLLYVMDDNKLYYDGNPVATGSGGGISGPNSSINDSIPRFDGTAGDKVKDSNLIVDDKGYITASGLYGIKPVLKTNYQVNGNQSVCVGDNFADVAFDALYANVAVGGNNLTSPSLAGTNNIAIGVDCGTALTDGSYNLLIGEGSAQFLATGSGNIVINSNVPNLVAGNGNLYVNANTFADEDNTLRIAGYQKVFLSGLDKTNTGIENQYWLPTLSGPGGALGIFNPNGTAMLNCANKLFWPTANLTFSIPITTVNVGVELAPSGNFNFSFTNTTRFTNSGNGRVKFNGTLTQPVKVVACVSFYSTVAGKDWKFELVRNGVQSTYFDSVVYVTAGVANETMNIYLDTIAFLSNGLEVSIMATNLTDNTIGYVRQFSIRTEIVY